MVKNAIYSWAGTRGCAANDTHLFFYPSKFGDEHRIFGKCARCGKERELSNTTHRRFIELGGTCRWLRCKHREQRRHDQANRPV